MHYSLSDFKSVTQFVFDIDGVMTNGSLQIQSDGELLRTVNIRDGYALQLAVKKGFSVGIISGASGEAIRKRFTGLGIQHIYLAVNDKVAVLHEMIARNGFDPSALLYMGDDMPDLLVMQQVFLPSCPADACEEIKSVSKYISPYEGGAGCVRDVIEKVLKLNQCWE